ncbi:TolC family protein [Luteibacter aegosomatissinici]|uniref:TolC family protein n=1 Tax=Luteibacter aegosomatissinici TaxID=2911539 RepID=UPI001FF72CED|nr:TolC family protein [Luteibacter aegosomatissinici]UPG94299.1 TolC family protein [Luteibacter aegosomatissinici]
MSTPTQRGLLLVLLAAVPAAHAAEAPAYRTLLQQSLERAPLLLEQSALVDAARGDARQARAWQNPTIDVLDENLSAPAPGGVSQQQITYSLTVPLELGKRGARIAAGERGVDAAQARQRQAEVDFSARLAETYAVAEASVRRHDLAMEDVARARDDLRAATALVSSGREASLRQAQAQAGVSGAQAVEAAAKADAIEALERLAALVGAPESYTAIPTSLLDAPATPVAGEGDSLAVATAEAERAAQIAQVKVEQRKRLPDFGVTAGTRRFGGYNGSGLVVGISATVPLFDQNRGGIAAAQARLDAADARLAAARLDSTAAQRAAAAQVAASADRLSAAEGGEAAAAEAYRLGRVGYEAGRTPLLELLITRRALTDARLATVDARLARVRALAEFARANGRIAFGE